MMILIIITIVVIVVIVAFTTIFMGLFSYIIMSAFKRKCLCIDRVIISVVKSLCHDIMVLRGTVYSTRRSYTGFCIHNRMYYLVTKRTFICNRIKNSKANTLRYGTFGLRCLNFENCASKCAH